MLLSFRSYVCSSPPFQNASWIINSLQVYQKSSVTGATRSDGNCLDISLASVGGIVTSFATLAWTIVM